MADFGEGKKKKRRLEFTTDPANTDIPIIAADVIYNLRSALDHLMSRLVKNEDRTSAIFPIYFQGVWDAIVPGENQQRVKSRLRWASDIKTVKPAAVAILKALQPPDTNLGGDDAHTIRLINRLSNRDRHEKLPVIAAGLSNFRTQIRKADGTLRHALGKPNIGSVIENHAEIHGIPYDAVDVQVQGIPQIAIKISSEKGKLGGYFAIPVGLIDAAALIENEIFPRLMLHVRR